MCIHSTARLRKVICSGHFQSVHQLRLISTKTMFCIEPSSLLWLACAPKSSLLKSQARVPGVKSLESKSESLLNSLNLQHLFPMTKKQRRFKILLTRQLARRMPRKKKRKKRKLRLSTKFKRSRRNS